MKEMCVCVQVRVRALLTQSRPVLAASAGNDRELPSSRRHLTASDEAGGGCLPPAANK